MPQGGIGTVLSTASCRKREEGPIIAFPISPSQFTPPPLWEDGARSGYPLQYSWASLVAQVVKNLPAMQETQDQSLDQEDPLEKEMVTHSSILGWRIP